jgi:hypothetical protein
MVRLCAQGDILIERVEDAPVSGPVLQYSDTGSVSPTRQMSLPLRASSGAVAPWQWLIAWLQPTQELNPWSMPN